MLTKENLIKSTQIESKQLQIKSNHVKWSCSYQNTVVTVKNINN